MKRNSYKTTLKCNTGYAVTNSYSKHHLQAYEIKEMLISTSIYFHISHNNTSAAALSPSLHHKNSKLSLTATTNETQKYK